MKPSQIDLTWEAATDDVAGAYDETSSGYVLNLSSGGYTIRSYPSERAKLFGIIQIKNTASGVTLSRLDIEGNGDANTLNIYATDVVVERSDITNAWRGGSGMILGSDELGAAVRTIVRRYGSRQPRHGPALRRPRGPRLPPAPRESVSCCCRLHTARLLLSGSD